MWSYAVIVFANAIFAVLCALGLPQPYGFYVCFGVFTVGLISVGIHLATTQILAEHSNQAQAVINDLARDNRRLRAHVLMLRHGDVLTDAIERDVEELFTNAPTVTSTGTSAGSDTPQGRGAN